MITLTKQQIENWRLALGIQYGYFVAKFMSDEDIVTYANRLQNAIDEHSLIHWDVKIRTNQDLITPWEQIAKEPKSPYLSQNAITRACKSLLARYPAIVAIQIMPSMEPEAAKVLEREKGR